MAFPASTVMTQVRNELRDTDNANYSWTDARLWGYLTQGVRDIKGNRDPASRAKLNAPGEVSAIPLTDIAANTESIDLDAVYIQPLIHWVIFKAYSEEGDDNRDLERATFHQRMYEAHFKSVEG